MTTHAHESNHSKIDGLHLKQELTRARKAAAKFTDHAIEAGHENPRAAAAVLVGTGMLLGSLVYRLAVPPPTATQLIGRSLQRGATSAGRSLLSGLRTARKLMH